MLTVFTRQWWNSGISGTGRRYIARRRGCGTCTLVLVPCMIISKHGTGGWRNIGSSSWTCRRGQAMSDRHTVMLNIVLLIAGGLFAVGICAPLMTVQKWLVFTQTYTLGAGLLRLFEAKHSVLFVLVGTFSLVVPLVKMGLLALACNLPSWTTAHSPRLLHWLALCGKWSMLDVFLVAILIAVGTL